MNIQAIALCRVSTMGQMKDGNLEPQEERIIRAAATLGLDIADDAWWKVAASSRKGKNIKRTDLNEMERYCMRHKRVRYLIIDEPDRFMRSIDEYYYWKVKFKIINVKLVRADKPDLDMDDPRNVFDELIDVYKAEQSNQERITKTPEKQMSKMRAGYYPFAPLPGYRTTTVPSLHEIDPERFYLLQEAFRAVASYVMTPDEALRDMTSKGYRTVNGFMMDMARFKQIAVKPYYAGIIQVADWEVATENGLHPHMISKDEREALLSIFAGKKRKFVVNRKNPDFPMNETLCYDCTQEEINPCKVTGYRNHNGKVDEIGDRHYYERYRCRGCNTYFTKQELHEKVSSKLNGMKRREEAQDELIKQLRAVWREHRDDNRSKVVVLQNRVHHIEAEQSKMAAALATTDNEVVKKAMIAAIEGSEHDKVAVQVDIKKYSDVDEELDAFIGYSVRYTENLRERYWSLDWDKRKRCERLLFPDGFYVTRQKKVYTPTISPIYRYERMKKEPALALLTVNDMDGGRPRN